MVSYARIAISVYTFLSICKTIRCSIGPPVNTLCSTRLMPDLKYKIAVGQVLQKVIEKTPYKGYNFYAQTPWPEIVYGHAACNGEIKLVECRSCVDAAGSMLLDRCPNSMGAQMELNDCRIRWESYPFSD